METIIKRDGTEVPFDVAKVEAAICKAFQACGHIVPEVAAQMAREVANHCEEWDLAAEGGTPTVEQVQDVVESLLMQEGYTDVAKAYILYRQRRSELREVGCINRLEIANYIHSSKYARYRPEVRRRETFEETVERNMYMHMQRFPFLKPDIERAYDLVSRRMVMPSMRSMQFAGAAIEQNNARMYNCSYSLCDRHRVFAEAFYLLLSGCGTGVGIHKEHVAKLPEIKPMSGEVKHFVIPDSIEGWAEAVEFLWYCLTEGIYPEFSYHKIRPEGAALVTSGGTAPGHLPLKAALEKCRDIMTEAAGRKLRPIECGDILCHLAEAVLAGGIRRSSMILLFSEDDHEMLISKHPWNFQHGGKNKQRAMANISVVLYRGTVTKDQFKHIVMDLNRGNYNGEPGFYFTDDPRHGTNPCGEIGLDPVLRGGIVSAREVQLPSDKTGWAFCNLTEINAAACKNKEDFLAAAWAASFIGTLQASYTDFGYLGEVTELIVKRDALLGVSISGIQDNPEIALRPDILMDASDMVKVTNKETADLIGIRAAKRLTCVKPSGTASLEMGGIGSGIHPAHARRYFRRVTANKNEVPALYFRAHNPHAVEVKPNGDLCLTFPIESPRGARTVKTLAAGEFLDDVFLVYENWIKPGTRDPGGLTHNVSCTVAVGDGEWDEVFEKVWHNRDRVQSMTFIPKMSDKGIPFMPREEVTTEADVAKWRELVSKWKPVDYHHMDEHTDGTKHVQVAACEGSSCEVR